MTEDSSANRARPGLGDFFERVLGEERAVREQIDRNARALAQTALSKLDVVSRDEFDAQTELLRKTRDRVEALEKEVAALNERLDQADQPT